MKLIRILPVTLVVLALSACGGAPAPTAADPDLRPRMNAGGVFGGSGNDSEGGTLSSDPTAVPPTPSDTTQIGVNRGGFIGSGT
ncbi:MAG TPA: hypothetical protein VFR81_16040 [Longimicrobium sp.]|nr:hypothetical protein [Longimicrobium sp.]